MSGMCNAHHPLKTEEKKNISDKTPWVKNYDAKGKRAIIPPC